MKLLLLTLLSLPLGAQPFYTQSIAAGNQLPATPAAATSIPTGIPLAVAVDSGGRVYYSAANCIFRVDTDGTADRIAGTGHPGFSGDGGPAIDAELDAPEGIAIDAAGDVFVSDTGNGRIRRIAPSGIIGTIQDGFYAPVGIAVDKTGNIYVADSVGNAVHRISSDGLMTTIAEGVQLSYPNGVAVDGLGDVFIADSNNQLIRKVAADGTVSTIATGTSGEARDPRTGTVIFCATLGSVGLCGPESVAADAGGNVYFADTFGNKVVRVSDGSTIAATYPSGVAVDSAGNVYIVGADKDVTRVASNGLPAKIAGSGADIDNNAQTFWTGLGADPLHVTDAAGNVYTADKDHFRVTKTPAGNGPTTIVAGNGSPGFSGDGGPATEATMYGPFAIALDGAGNLFIADNYRVREVRADGIIHTVAGDGGQAFYPAGDDGPAVDVQLFPDAIAVDSQGNLFIGVRGTNSVRGRTGSSTPLRLV